MAPNAITLAGFIMPFLSCMYIFYYDLTMTAVLPASVHVLAAFAMFWYATLDAIDGK